MIHRDCGGEIILDESKTYDYELDNGVMTEVPAWRCRKCGKEILGDAEIELNEEEKLQ